MPLISFRSIMIKTVTAYLIFTHCVIYKKSGQVKECCKPADHSDNMKGFNPEHVCVHLCGEGFSAYESSGNRGIIESLVQGQFQKHGIE